MRVLASIDQFIKITKSKRRCSFILLFVLIFLLRCIGSSFNKYGGVIGIYCLVCSFLFVSVLVRFYLQQRRGDPPEAC